MCLDLGFLDFCNPERQQGHRFYYKSCMDVAIWGSIIVFVILANDSKTGHGLIVNVV